MGFRLKTKFFWGMLILCASYAEASGRLLQPGLQPAKPCVGEPDFLSESRIEPLNYKAHWPQVYFVAREVEFYIQGTHEGIDVKLHGAQNFLQTQKPAQILCANAPNLEARWSMVAPTLIDSRQVPRVGESPWQFQVIAKKGLFAFWNFKSTTLQNPADLESVLKSSAIQYKMYQRSHDEYELLMTKVEHGLTYTLSVRYDAVAKK